METTLTIIGKENLPTEVGKETKFVTGTEYRLDGKDHLLVKELTVEILPPGKSHLSCTMCEMNETRTGDKYRGEVTGGGYIELASRKENFKMDGLQMREIRETKDINRLRFYGFSSGLESSFDPELVRLTSKLAKILGSCVMVEVRTEYADPR